jgi:hypothetical protein
MRRSPAAVSRRRARGYQPSGTPGPRGTHAAAPPLAEQPTCQTSTVRQPHATTVHTVPAHPAQQEHVANLRPKGRHARTGDQSLEGDLSLERLSDRPGRRLLAASSGAPVTMLPTAGPCHLEAAATAGSLSRMSFPSPGVFSGGSYGAAMTRRPSRPRGVPIKCPTYGPSHPGPVYAVGWYLEGRCRSLNLLAFVTAPNFLLHSRGWVSVIASSADRPGPWSGSGPRSATARPTSARSPRSTRG